MENGALPEHRGARFSLPISDSLDKAVIRQLATCRWIAEHHQVLVIGATGTGKTFIACALANHACG
jgi:DNA replication protein DnaC